MKFLVDQPLGSLIKWLRFLGFDAASVSLTASRPGRLPAPAAGTYLLTAQGSLARLGRRDILVLTALVPEEQLREVLRRLKISRRDLAPMSRCVRCNAKLQAVAREAARGEVPDHILVTQKEFYQCPVCRRFFWPGSHLPGIGRSLSGILHQNNEDDGGQPTREEE